MSGFFVQIEMISLYRKGNPKQICQFAVLIVLQNYQYLPKKAWTNSHYNRKQHFPNLCYSYTSKSLRGKEFTWSKWSQLWPAFCASSAALAAASAASRASADVCDIQVSIFSILNYFYKIFFLSFFSLCCNCKVYIAVRSVKSQF